MKISIFTKNIIIVILGFFLKTSATASEEAKYDIVYKNNIYEIRFYPKRLIVESVYNDSKTFRKLFNYISGANNNSEEIEMTIPVTQVKKDNTIFMQFILPSKFTKETIPIPLNSDIEISIIEKGYFAIIEYSGKSSDKNFIRYSKILQGKLLEDKILIKGSPIKASYNGPFTPSPLRRNEVMFNIKWKS